MLVLPTQAGAMVEMKGAPTDLALLGLKVGPSTSFLTAAKFAAYRTSSSSRRIAYVALVAAGDSPSLQTHISVAGPGGAVGAVATDTGLIDTRSEDPGQSGGAEECGTNTAASPVQVCIWADSIGLGVVVTAPGVSRDDAVNYTTALRQAVEQ
ncbi:MAG TPA: hypothetical protein VFA70_14690 [Dehalococcoidia bacterium]|nr:hypothetical protein [Dehalococcoidia bacterium]